jgi:hypothetical protein
MKIVNLYFEGFMIALLNQIPSPQGHEIQHPDRVESKVE